MHHAACSLDPISGALGANSPHVAAFDNHHACGAGSRQKGKVGSKRVDLAFARAPGGCGKDPRKGRFHRCNLGLTDDMGFNTHRRFGSGLGPQKRDLFGVFGQNYATRRGHLEIRTQLGLQGGPKRNRLGLQR